MILVDTNILLAGADTDSADHPRCATVLDDHTDLAVTGPVAVETAWMIESRLGPIAESEFVASIADGDLVKIDLTIADWARCADLIRTYHDLGLGLVDASVVAVAERLDIVTVATLNRRDFTVVRPSHTNALELIP